MMATHLLDLRLPQDATRHLVTAYTPEEWEARCQDIRDANGGDYPRWWVRVIVKSGIEDAVSCRWAWDVWRE